MTPDTHEEKRSSLANAPDIGVLVTGDHEDWLATAPERLAGSERTLRWESVEVLQFERLPLAADLLERVATAPFDWIVFASRRAVRFFAETLAEKGLTLPLETQVACIGERTAQAADTDGFTPDFFPVDPGSEGFLREFEELLLNRSDRPTVFLPIAEGGRLAVAQKLREFGCTVTVAPLYRTTPHADLPARLAKIDWSRLDAILFTSPSSVEAVLGTQKLPERLQVFALGAYTAERVKAHGVPVAGLLREGQMDALRAVLTPQGARK